MDAGSDKAVGSAEDSAAPQSDTPAPEAIEATTTDDKTEVGLFFPILITSTAAQRMH